MKRINSVTDALNTNKALVDVGDGIVIPLPVDGVFGGEQGPAGVGVPAGGTSGQVVQRTAAGTMWTTPSKELVGLTQVDNTADLEKPLSEPQALALTNKADLIDGRVPAGQLDLSALVPTNGARPVGKGELVIRAADYIKADGVTNDTVGLQAAATDAINAGIPLHLPAGRSIVIGGRWNLPEGLQLHTNGSTLLTLAGTSDHVVQIGANVRVSGGIRLLTSASVNQRGVAIYGNGIQIDSLEVRASAPATGSASANGQAIRIEACSHVSIGRVIAENFERPLTIKGCTNIDITSLTIVNYLRGAYFVDVRDSSVGGGTIAVASPNAAPEAGHNGILIEATTDGGTDNLTLDKMVVRDSGEHGIRIGGQRMVRNVRINSPSIINVGRSGIKVLGGTIENNNIHRNIYILDAYIEDAGPELENSAAIMLHMVDTVVVSDPIVRKNLKTFSAGKGVEIQAGNNVTVSNPDIAATQYACYEVRGVLGDSTQVRLVGGRLTSTSGDGIAISYTNRRFRWVSVEGYPQVDISGTGSVLNISNTGGTGSIGGTPMVSWHSVAAADKQIAAAATLSGYTCDVRATFSGTPAFRNGSIWVDSTTGTRRIRSGAAWKEPALV